jgi:Zn-dependent M28 family amino/carboxypeptidase
VPIKKVFSKVKNSDKRDVRKIRRNLYRHIKTLTDDIGERNSVNYDALEQTHRYIKGEMERSSFNLKDLSYKYRGHEYHNIIAEKIGHEFPDEIFITGAHYDTVIHSPGADDNSSGIAALLELVRLFDNYDNKRTIRFVAFTLEEPPFYGTSNMGSRVYAKACKAKRENIIMMIALEMLAYFTNKKNSQNYPTPDMAADHPNKGNFIGIVGNADSERIVDIVSTEMKNYADIPVESIISLPHMLGASFSDHGSFWEFGYRAIMITDTAFYRNPYYHQPEDTIETLNFKYFSKFVHGFSHVLKKLDVNGL